MNIAAEVLEQGVMSFSSLFHKASNLLGFGGQDRLQPPPLDGEIIYCKNNVCVHPPANLNRATEHYPGYLNIRSQDDEVTILIKHLVYTEILILCRLISMDLF